MRRIVVMSVFISVLLVGAVMFPLAWDTFTAEMGGTWSESGYRAVNMACPLHQRSK